MILGAVTIRERVERVRIEDPFVVDQFVVFGTGPGAELILFGIPVHAVGLDDGGDTRLGLRPPEFIQGVLLEDLIVELGLSFGVEGETADLAFGFTAGGHVAVVLGSSGTEFDDVVAWVEFIGEITEKIPERGLDGWIVGALDKDDRIGVGIENPRTEMIEGAVEMESGMTGSETGHEDIEIGRIRFAVVLHLVVDFDPFFGDGADPAHVMGTAIQELPEIGRIDEFFDLCLVGLLPEFPPHGIQHEFRQSTLPGVLADIGMMENNVFAFVPSSDVFALEVSCGAVLGIPAGFFLEFEPRVDVLGKESHLRVGEMVDLMNVEESVPFLEGHDEFRRAPRTGESALSIGVMAVVHVLVE
ncbi:uncharacterized protein LOC122949621 [Acropora millepora]|uniref:uncharacterized protein LOC122949621 n=1 Tax=Acropora millepora TaxID=45264 RepID=UPI001CF2AF06|nr:uncharacterized protein LOC122949621 [Acropora millepora]